MLDASIDKYLANISVRSGKTQTGYGYTMRQFYSSRGNKALRSITRQELIDFEGFLQRQDLSDRTIHNRIGEFVTFLRHFGFKEVKLRIKFTEKVVRAYRAHELKQLLRRRITMNG